MGPYDQRLVRAIYVLVAIAVTLTLVAALPRWPRTAADQWIALAAIAAWVTAGMAALGLVALLYLREQVEGLRQQTRLQFIPYLRVDLAPDRSDGMWAAPDVPDRYRFDYAAFNPESTEQLDIFSNWRGGEETEICLWLENQQLHTSSIASNVVIRITIKVADSDGGEPQTIDYNLNVQYLEPGRRIRYKLGAVSNRVPYLWGRIEELAYLDMYRNPRSFAHGSVEFEWRDGRVVYRRDVFRVGDG